MARRGSELREHILFAAKEVFLELGYDRASMDVVAARAATSKRSVYAHFENKGALFRAVIEFVRELHLDKLKEPGHYSPDTVEAVTLFCGRFLQTLLWRPIVRTCRLVITEAERLPDASARYHETMFTDTCDRLAAYIAQRQGFSESESAVVAGRMLARTVYPVFVRALFGAEKLTDEFPREESIAVEVDLTPIRDAAADLLGAAAA
ncbi:TetR/AcrR family transcriptional regulator [Nocardia wallacei]|uniref:TetR/AcrR family transcriptional regulator n=1 Tax=Nocardia wallacei TaxID=480035 RepID=UPI0024572CA8|nr:TetR/AcrR family transcriptional regulator [Nocardia wallacei]